MHPIHAFFVSFMPYTGRGLPNFVMVLITDATYVKPFSHLIRNQYLQATAVFLVTTFVFFRPHIMGKAFFWDDFIEQIYPNRVYAARTLAEGKFPHWNPYSFCGMPFQADVQTALYYPPYFLFDRFIGAHVHNGTYWLQLLIIAHFLVAQLAMFILARQLGLSVIGSIIAAIAYTFAAPLALHTHHPMFIEHLAWLPLVIVFLRRTIISPSIAAVGWCGLIGGMMLLSGAPQMSLYALSFSIAAALWWSVTEHSTWKIRARRFAKAMAALALAIGIYGIQYFPSRQLAAESERTKLTYEQATEGSLSLSSFLTAIVPKAYGIALPHDMPNPMPYYQGAQYLYWDTAFYFGVGTFILAMWTVVMYWKESSLVRMLVVASVAAILFALGSNGFLYWFIYHLPFFGQVRIPARMMFVVTFAASLLAGLGWDRLLTCRSPRARPVLLSVTIAVFAIIVGVGAHILVTPPARQASAIASSAWGQAVFALMTIGFALLRYRGIGSPWLGLAVAAITFFDLQTAHAAFSRGKLDPAVAYRSALPDELRAILLPKLPSDVFRVSMRRPEMMALFRNQGLTDGVMLFEGYNQLLLRRRHPAVSSPALVADMLAVRWALGKDSLGRWAFLPRQSAYPIAWLVHNVRVVPPEQVADVMKNDTTIDYRTTAVIEQELSIPLGAKSRGDTISVVQYDNDRLRYLVRCSSPTLAVLSEIYYPGWAAYLDGQQVPLLRANYCLRAVAVPAGEHTLELRFESAAFAVGSLVTAASLALAFSLVVIESIRRLQQRPLQRHD